MSALLYDRRTRRQPVHRASSGFTLIELMIAVAIVAILAAVAVPSYMDSVWKGKRAEGKAAIMKTLQAEERWYTQSNTYVAYASASPPSGGAFPGYSADTASNSRYQISVSPLANNLCTGTGASGNIAQCAVITATVIGNPDPKCGQWLAMDTVGRRSAATTANIDFCWK